MSTFKSRFLRSKSSISKKCDDKPLENKDLPKPTGREYAGHAAKDFLSILEAVAQAVPVPGLVASVKLATKIIKACDESEAILEHAQELKHRIKVLVLTLVNELKGRESHEIQAKLRQDIKRLERFVALYLFSPVNGLTKKKRRDMEYIELRLNEITSQHSLLVILFRNLNEDKVRKCVARLDTSLKSFSLAREIEHTDLLTRLEQQITSFHAMQQRSLKDLQITMDYVKTKIDEHLPASPTSPSHMRAPMPANTAIFHGRETIVAELVVAITGASRRSVCLLGPGGMGKTSTALAVMGHPDVKSYFPDGLRIWVPCVKATSIFLFLDALRSSLAISQKSGNTLGDILSVLKASPPIVILLDNFETPWINAESGQAEVERVLRDIHQFPHVTLFVTMRSSVPPCGDLPWCRVDLRAVDTEAAHKIYTSWRPEGRQDPDLPHLLELIGNMPLAVTLMAKLAELTGLSAQELVGEYQNVGTQLMGQGSDSENNMDVCISLSVDSPRMKARPEAFHLLCMLSMLPVGTSYEMLSKWWAKDLRNLMIALGVLKSTSLVEQRGSTYFVLPVIQRYILHPSRFLGQVRTSMIEAACAFLQAHDSEIGEPLYKTHNATLSAEAGNLEAVLFTVTIPDRHVLSNGFLLLARHQRFNKPRDDLIEHALTLARDVHDNTIRGDLLYCYSDIAFQFSRYDQSLKQFEESLTLFLSVPDRKKAAECRLAINNTLAMHPEGDFTLRQQIIHEAQEDYEFVGDKAGEGRCLLAHGALHRQYSNYPEAISLLEQAELVLAEVQDPHRHAECAQVLAHAYYRASEHDSAYTWGISALEEYEAIGLLIPCVYVVNTIGQALSALGDYQGALTFFLRCIEIHRSVGIPLSGNVLEGMGLAWAKLGQTSDAQRAFDQCLEQYSSAEPSHDSQCGVIRSQFFLKHLETPDLEPTLDEHLALSNWYPDDHIDNILAQQ
ncbi:hypothetical protein DXG01_011338 [Tephrocybe rancida]|nr:hypothetical protein DXG01_011338 [Tephrocybe rancida]